MCRRWGCLSHPQSGIGFQATELHCYIIIPPEENHAASKANTHTRACTHAPPRTPRSVASARPYGVEMPRITADAEELKGLPNDTYLAFVEVVDDLAAQSLFPLPLCLGWVVQKFPQRPLLPLQQLTVEEQGECGLCGDRQ